jgi:hypothetical protein
MDSMYYYVVWFLRYLNWHPQYDIMDHLVFLLTLFETGFFYIKNTRNGHTPLTQGLF